MGIFSLQSGSVNKTQRANLFQKEKKTHILFKERRGKSELMLGPTRQALRLSNRARLSEVIMSSEDKQGALVWSVTCAAFPDASQTLYSYVVFDEL